MDKVGEVLGKALLQVDLLLLLSGVQCDFEERYSVVTIMSLTFHCGKCNSKGASFRRVLSDVSEVYSSIGATAWLLGPLSLKYFVRLNCGSYPRVDQ